ncbi:molecular chaperone HtpG [Geobacter hydrogenophilus]|uniref:Chaperone protein HtpG n=1 Tax=Geobacter hydrogenophilus TaxID=40983 RepID=A0A9W6G3U3_9BACT|nr:molecular chaperone HtpG [Geobacter hydrogenophilus]MBT0892447.1 molecular chaperone HtpG [Geobacter hydrogenophilus]GLI39843.1 chaperone protein HtpG [Geobacter hydrogenophilus]
MTKTTKKFETEVQQLLDLVIHSLYSNKDIFLRELISNASDAIDKVLFESHQNVAVIEGEPEGKIKLIPDKEAGTITIRDNGVGMTLEEVEKNIGTIAHSGTKAFLANLKEQNVAEHPELIGQFGVGFYASFMVADRVTLVTRRAGHDKAAGVRWESTGDGTYTVEETAKETRGTEITLHLKEEMKEYLDEWKIRSIVRKYSDYVQYPIVMDVTRTEVPKGVNGEEIEGAGTIEKTVEETLNSMKAIWTRAKSEVTDEEYEEFYKHVSHDFEKPLKTIHYSAEGVSEFKALLYLPAHKPFDLFMPERKKGVQLYVRRVFITDSCEQLIPDYLRFVKGVVDSSDLPLNVSREILQEDVQIKRIQKSLVGKILSTLSEMREKEADDYLTFYKEFGQVLKEGVHFDYANRDKLQDLLLFESTKTDAGEFTSLKEYVERMPEGQEEIYFITGTSRAALEQSPHLEIFRKKEYEVLFLTDPVDEWVVQGVTEYGGKKLKAVDRGDVIPATEEEKKEQEAKREEAAKQYGDLLSFVKEKLDARVKEVRLSSRLTDSACCLVADEHGLNANMERILRAMNQDVPDSKRILELNPDHPIMQVMANLFGKDKANPRLADYCDLLYDQALLTEGSPITDPLRFTRLVAELMVADGKAAAGE